MRPITISADNFILRFCSGSTTSRAWRCNPFNLATVFPIIAIVKNAPDARCQRCISVALSLRED